MGKKVEIKKTNKTIDKTIDEKIDKTIDEKIDENNSIDDASLKDFKPLPNTNDQYPIEYMESNSVIKLKEDAEYIAIGICDPGNLVLLENLQSFHKKDVQFFKIEKSELTSYLSDILANIDGSEGTSSSVSDEKLMLDKLANDAPIVNLVNSIFINE